MTGQPAPRAVAAEKSIEPRKTMASAMIPSDLADPLLGSAHAGQTSEMSWDKPENSIGVVSTMRRCFTDAISCKNEALSPSDDLLYFDTASLASKADEEAFIKKEPQVSLLTRIASDGCLVQCADLQPEGEEHVRAGVIASVRVLLDSDDATLSSGQTNFEGICNLLNSNLGAALLTMPQLFEVFGIWLSIVALSLSAVLNYLGVNLIFAACYHKQVGGLNYTALGLHSLGNFFRLWVVSILTVSTFCNMTNYLLATEVALEMWLVRLLGFDLSSISLMLISTCLYLPFTLVRSMKGIAIFSAMAAVAAIIMVILSLVLVGTHGVLPGRENVPLSWGPGPYPFLTLMAVAPRCVLTFSNQSSACIVAAQMKDSSRGNLKRVTRAALAIVYLISLCLGGAMYWMIRTNIPSDFLEGLPVSPLTQAIHFATLVLVGVSYIFNVAPCRIFAIELLFKKNENVFEASQVEFYFVTILLNGLAFFAAAFAADNGGVGLVAGLAGAICSSSLAFIFPPIIAVAVRSQETYFKQRSRLGRANLKYYLLMVLGVVILVTGVYANLASTC